MTAAPPGRRSSPPSTPPMPNMRPEIAVTLLPNGKTRMYVGRGHQRATPTSPAVPQRRRGHPARPGRSPTSPAPDPDRSRASAPSITARGQCWYDNLVDDAARSSGHRLPRRLLPVLRRPGDVSNGRALVLSTDAGADLHRHDQGRHRRSAPERPAPGPPRARGHPPDNPYQFFNGSDGGVMRSSGDFTDVSARLRHAGPRRARALSRCRQLPVEGARHVSTSINRGLSTLQFQSLSVSPFDHRIVQGGTQDNGTFQTTGSTNRCGSRPSGVTAASRASTSATRTSASTPSSGPSWT